LFSHWQQFYSLRNTFMGFASAAPTARALNNVTPQHAFPGSFHKPAAGPLSSARQFV
jgi:hypothetical protein